MEREWFERGFVRRSRIEGSPVDTDDFDQPASQLEIQFVRARTPGSRPSDPFISHSWIMGLKLNRIKRCHLALRFPGQMISTYLNHTPCVYVREDSWRSNGNPRNGTSRSDEFCLELVKKQKRRPVVRWLVRPRGWNQSDIDWSRATISILAILVLIRSIIIVSLFVSIVDEQRVDRSFDRRACVRNFEAYETTWTKQPSAVLAGLWFRLKSLRKKPSKKIIAIRFDNSVHELFARGWRDRPRNKAPAPNLFLM